MGYFQMWFRNFIKAHFYSGAHCFMQFFWFVFIFLPIFCHLIPKKRFLDICTSSYHALTCDYREFHAYLAPCGCGIWGCSEREDSTVDQSCVHSKVRPLQDSPALLNLPTLSGFREVSGKNLKASAKCAGSWHTRVLLPIIAFSSSFTAADDPAMPLCLWQEVTCLLCSHLLPLHRWFLT